MSANTPYETTAYRCDTEKSGPTAVIIGGQHGTEPSGVAGAQQIVDNYKPVNGELILIPDADPTVNLSNPYVGVGGNMNDQWTVDGPTSEPAQVIWDLLFEFDADYVIDLHSSHGVYGGTPSGVGQAIFPTPGVTRETDQVCDYITTQVMHTKYDRSMAYRRGNTLYGTPPNRLIRAIAPHMEGIIAEPTRANGTTLAERSVWNRETARKFIELVGLRTTRQ